MTVHQGNTYIPFPGKIKSEKQKTSGIRKRTKDKNRAFL